jgi:SAM-dependent methyltransferase
MENAAPPGFDEANYLAANPDVAQAVASGTIRSGLAHYLAYGANENRALRPGVRATPFQLPFRAGQIPQRRDKILAGLDLGSRDGVEIGALATPLVTKAEGNIFYVDHAGTKDLRDIYHGHEAVDGDKIVDVDGIWGKNTLQDCIGKNRKADYVVASHVIEHVPDLITWLGEIRSVLRPNGTLRLAIPDRRFTFDYLRVETRIHDVLDAYLRRARTPLPRLILEHHHLTRRVDAKDAWRGTLDGADLERLGTLQNGLALARGALADGAYHDVHCWVFTPASFAGLCVELAANDLLDFACDYYFDTARDESEFFVSMIASEARREIVGSWAEMRAALSRSDR